MVPRIVVQAPSDNLDARYYHTSVEISETLSQSFARPLRSRSEWYLREVGSTGSAIVRAVLSMPGVNSVSIGPYQVFVCKSLAFDWEEIHPAILKALMDALETRECQVVDRTGSEPVTQRAFSKTSAGDQPNPLKNIRGTLKNLRRRFWPF